MTLDVLLLPGDGVGPEVTEQAVRVLREVARVFHHTLDLAEGLIGGQALARTGSPLPDGTKRLAASRSATLLGAVGLPEYDSQPPDRRPERGLLELRRALGVYANLRPVRTSPASLAATPLRPEIARGTDLVIVRELTSGIYYGTPRGVSGSGPDERAVNTMSYTRGEVERVGRIAFELSRGRRRKVTSVDKANVLENSQLWRRVVTEIGSLFPDVTLDHLLVDNCAMQLVLNPGRFDVVLTENMFGDILSDEAAVLSGSIGMLPSASLGGISPTGARVGLYEPVHGSAPDIAGKNIANPLGAIGSVALMLRHSFRLEREAKRVEEAIDAAVTSGRVTADMRPDGSPATTAEVGDAVSAALGGL